VLPRRRLRHRVCERAEIHDVVRVAKVTGFGRRWRSPR
jgi:hypothetical protein